MTFSKSQSGFTFVQTMLGLAFVGGISLLLMRQQEITTQNNKKADFVQDMNYLVTSMHSALTDRLNCTATVQNKQRDELLPGIFKGIPQDRGVILGVPIFEVNKEYTSSRIKIVEIKPKLVPEDTPGKVYLPYEKKEVLRVVMSTNDGSKKFSKDIFVSLQMNGTGTLYTGCASTLTNLVQNTCHSLGASWDQNQQKCIFEGKYPKCITSNNDECSSAYPHKYTYSAQETFGERRLCSREFKAPWQEIKERSCTCYGTGCTCSPPSPGEKNWIDVWEKHTETECEDNFETKSTAFIKCCRDSLAGEP